jgi:hypothetical protein
MISRSLNGVFHKNLKLQRRCCIRFSNIADWHKRLTNDPMSEVADINKNDMIYDKRAMNRKAEIEATKELTRALEEVKSEGKPRKRARGNDLSSHTTGQPTRSSGQSSANISGSPLKKLKIDNGS